MKIMKNKFMWYFFLYFFYVIINTYSLPVYIMFPFSSEQDKKKEEVDRFIVLYKGMEYQVPVSSQFGGQVIFKDENLATQYYIIISEKLDLNLDHKGNVRGYLLDEKYQKSSKMYSITMNIFNNSKNEMTYKWDIEEIQILSKYIPENTIIVYGDPAYLSLENFDSNFNKPYPCIQEEKSGILILPTLSFKVGSFRDELIKNANASIETKSGHSMVKQIH